MLIIFSYPAGSTAILELRSANFSNDYHVYSFVVCCLVFILYFFLWLICLLTVLMHYKYKTHPLVKDKFAFVYRSVKGEGLKNQMAIPVIITIRFASFIVHGLLIHYTEGPPIIQAFFNILVRVKC